MFGPKPGDLVSQRYRIETCLGRGGMGGVFLARHLQLNTVCALKCLHLASNNSEDPAVRQFVAEARLLTRLRHPNLPQVFDFFEDDGMYFLAMEYVPGRDLSKILEAESPLDLTLVVQWGITLCRTLDYLHAQDPPVIFRDLKPSNVMLDTSNQIRLVDFGIAKAVGADGATSTFAHGAGTFGYAPPEQYDGHTDERSDLYSLGATLYALVTGRHPLPAGVMAAEVTSLKLRTQRTDLPVALEMLIRQLMSIGPEQRPASAAEVLERLQAPDILSVDSDTQVADHQSASEATRRVPRSHATPAPLAPPTRPMPRRSWPSWAAGVAVGLIVLAGGIRVLTPNAPPSPSPSVTAPTVGTLYIQSVPSGATLSIGGRTQGVTPLRLTNLPPKVYELRFSKAGYSTKTTMALVEEGKVSEFSTQLDLAPVAVQVATRPSSSMVSVDGAGPTTDTTLSLSPGPHRLAVSHAGYITQQTHIDVPAQTSPWRVDVALSPEPKAANTPPPVAVVNPPATPGGPQPLGPPGRAPVGTDVVVVPGESVGNLRVGEKLDTTGWTRHVGPLGSVVYAKLEFGWIRTTSDGEIRLIAAHEGHTANGIGVSSSIEEVFHEFGTDPQQQKADGYRDYFYRDNGIGFRVFDVDPARVSTVYVTRPESMPMWSGWPPPRGAPGG